jgi:hypothetical protein
VTEKIKVLAFGCRGFGLCREDVDGTEQQKDNEHNDDAELDRHAVFVVVVFRGVH